MKFDLSTILSSEEITKRIAKIAKVGHALQTEIHEIAVQTLAHVAAHGDYTLATRLFGGLPSGQRRQALAAWYRHFSGQQVSFTYDKQSDTWKGKLSKGWSADAFLLDEAVATSYGDFLPEKGYSTLTMGAFIQFLKRKANEDGMNPNGTPKVEPQVRELCASLYARMQRPAAKIESIPLAALLVNEA
jgi:hypothetical protein